MLVAFALPVTPSLADEASFKADLETLTQNSHRLAGTPEGRAAGTHIIERLGEAGVDQVLTLEFPIWQTVVERAEMSIDGATLPLIPLKPSLFAAVNTPDEGLTGPMIYVGQGRLGDYGDRPAQGAIVALDYDSFDNWETAFSLGAKAVVFLDDGTTTNAEPLQAGIPADLVRLYARIDPATGLAEGGVDLRRDREAVTVHSRARWERTVGRDVLGIIRGTDPAFASRSGNLPEVAVLSASYNSYGNIPHLSPGARQAANVAGLLDTAGLIAATPPRRDTIVLFPGNDPRAHQGTRVFYDSLLMTPADHLALVQSHDAESNFITAALEILDGFGLTVVRGEAGSDRANEAAGTLQLKLRDEADWARADLQQLVQQLRLRNAGALTPADEPDRPQPELTLLEERMRRWDEVRRMLHREELPAFIVELRAIVAGETPPVQTESGALADALEEGDATGQQAEAKAMLALIDELESRMRSRLQRRLDELDLLQRSDKQRTAIRQALYRGSDPYWITLHVSYDLGDATPVWGPVIGEWTPHLFPVGSIGSGTDDPGYYNRLLAAFGTVVGDRAGELGVEPLSIRDTGFGRGFAPGRYVNGGAVAGSFGIYNLAVMTGYDARLRDGHPADTVANLDWQRLAGQARAAGWLLRDFADDAAQSQPRSFTANATSKRTTWSYGKSSGEYAKLQVTGGLSENRPAAGAMIALWPGASGRKGDALSTLDGTLGTPRLRARRPPGRRRQRQLRAHRAPQGRLQQPERGRGHLRRERPYRRDLDQRQRRPGPRRRDPHRHRPRFRVQLHLPPHLRHRARPAQGSAGRGQLALPHQSLAHRPAWRPLGLLHRRPGRRHPHQGVSADGPGRDGLVQRGADRHRGQRRLVFPAALAGPADGGRALATERDSPRAAAGPGRHQRGPRDPAQRREPDPRGRAGPRDRGRP